MIILFLKERPPGKRVAFLFGAVATSIIARIIAVESTFHFQSKSLHDRWLVKSSDTHNPGRCHRAELNWAFSPNIHGPAFFASRRDNLFQPNGNALENQVYPSGNCIVLKG
jgi:hypothetical protein